MQDIGKNEKIVRQALEGFVVEKNGRYGQQQTPDQCMQTDIEIFPLCDWPHNRANFINNVDYADRGRQKG